MNPVCFYNLTRRRRGGRLLQHVALLTPKVLLLLLLFLDIFKTFLAKDNKLSSTCRLYCEMSPSTQNKGLFLLAATAIRASTNTSVTFAPTLWRMSTTTCFQTSMAAAAA